MKTHAQWPADPIGDSHFKPSEPPALKRYELEYRTGGPEGDRVGLHFWGRDASVALFHAERHVAAGCPVVILENGKRLAKLTRSHSGYWRAEPSAPPIAMAVEGSRPEKAKPRRADEEINAQSLSRWENEGGSA